MSSSGYTFRKQLPSGKADEVNPATDGYAALEDALRATFGILKYVMLVLATMFALSGIYFVDEGTIGIHTRLGRIHRGRDAAVVEPGGPYFALPAPVDEVHIASTAMQEIVLESAFWFDDYGSENSRPLEKQQAARALDPGKHGSLLTGDQNIVHARWSASFQIERERDGIAANGLRFFRNVGTMSRAEKLVREALQRAAVRAVAHTKVEDFYKGSVDTDAIRVHMQADMDRLESGLHIVTVSLQDGTVPLAVLREFQAAGQAESEKARRIEEARQEREHILNHAAGSNYESLIAALDAYEWARGAETPKAVAEAEAVIDDLLLSDDTGGAVASMIRRAKTDRTRTVEFVRGASQRFQAMLQLHDENPSLYRSRQTQNALERIFRGNVRSFHLPPGDGKTIYLEMGDAAD
jgi:regulator of protease activity HflC (stomatin/prohibitin superfamily)